MGKPPKKISDLFNLSGLARDGIFMGDWQVGEADDVDTGLDQDHVWEHGGGRRAPFAALG